MSHPLLEQSLLDDAEPSENALLPGVSRARVVNNLDAEGHGRVQVELPWLPGTRPWARVATLSGGPGRGTYFIPQINDEVLVAFAHGDLAEPFVIGSLWSGNDRPPTSNPMAPVTNRIVRTPAGHQLDFDDLKQSVTLETSTGQTVEITPLAITIKTTGGTASLTLSSTGALTLEALQSITLKAPQINLSGLAVKVEGSARVQVQAGAMCEIQGGLVKIN